MASPDIERRTPSLNEKYNEKDDSASAIHHVGDVYDDVRDIDLGDDGKERPIGEQLSPPVAVVCL